MLIRVLVAFVYCAIATGLIVGGINVGNGNMVFYGLFMIFFVIILDAVCSFLDDFNRCIK